MASRRNLAGLPIARNCTGSLCGSHGTAGGGIVWCHARLKSGPPLHRRFSISGCSHEHGNHPLPFSAGAAGTDFSGGQKSRLALPRTLHRRYPEQKHQRGLRNDPVDRHPNLRILREDQEMTLGIYTEAQFRIAIEKEMSFLLKRGDPLIIGGPS
jgi:hypothetical protein